MNGNQNSAPPSPPQYVPSRDEDEIDLRQLLRALSEGRLIILGCVVGALVLAAFYAWVTPREFQSGALVQVEMESTSSLDRALGELESALGGQETPVSAEIELIKSRMVIGRVVDQLREFIVAEPRHFPVFGSAWARGYDGEEPAGAFLGMRQFAWGGEHIEVTNLEVGRELIGKDLIVTAQEGGRFVVHGPEGALVADDGTVGELLQVNTAFGPLVMFVQELRAEPGTDFVVVRRDRNKVISNLQEAVSVAERGSDSGILYVTSPGASPKQATQRVNRLVQAYQRQNVERRSQEAQQTLDFLNEQLPEVKQDLEAAEAELNRYRLSEGSADLTKETELVLERNVTLEQQRNELEQKRQEALRRFTDDHPVIQTIDAQLAKVREDMDALRSEVNRLPATQQELLRLNRDVEVNTELYTSLLNSAQELQITRAGTIGNVRIIDLGVEPDEPAKPRTSLILALALVLGGMFGVMAVFLKRALREGVEDPAEVEQQLGLPTYAAVPFSDEERKLDRQRRRRAKHSGESVGLLVEESPQSITAESLRSLRTSLHFALLDAPNRVLAITGPSPGLGKSFLSINFAAVLADAGNKVAVVDADLRRGHIHEMVGMSRFPGLTDYIAGKATAADILRPVHRHSNLSLITTGTIAPNPAELLMNQAFGDLLDSLKESHAYVIVDTPPILAVTDAAIVGRHVGATLLVLKEGEHPMAMIADATNRLRQSGVTVRGTIFNQMGRAAGRYGRGRYGYRYGYTYQYTSQT
ncbi:MAG: polysaccharide biosynthesis tyrosine autokinase [Abyssibacter sp.]|nr:polysaccharide biosynthesis tyrosine autokinase [Abyssibacter sp.]MCK5857900.1 polysaccharide biosynthesis tyrosine autokinase [Abyssibacter sp.]